VFVKSISNAGIHDSFEIVQLSRKPREKMEEKRKLLRLV